VDKRVVCRLATSESPHAVQWRTREGEETGTESCCCCCCATAALLHGASFAKLRTMMALTPLPRCSWKLCCRQQPSCKNPEPQTLTLIPHTPSSTQRSRHSRRIGSCASSMVVRHRAQSPDGCRISRATHINFSFKSCIVFREVTQHLSSRKKTSTRKRGNTPRALSLSLSLSLRDRQTVEFVSSCSSLRQTSSSSLKRPTTSHTN